MHHRASVLRFNVASGLRFNVGACVALAAGLKKLWGGALLNFAHFGVVFYNPVGGVSELDALALGKRTPS